jgi:hypothetical protein
VEYNTSTNPTFEGAVRDTSGRGNDGMFYGGASYDANEKALGFNKTDNQYVNTNIQSSLPTNGNYVHSFSMWFNPNSLTATSGDALLIIGDNDTNTKVEVFIESDRINFLFGNNSYEASPTILNGRWYHLGLTYNGVGGASGREIYLDGVKLTGTTTATAVLNLTNGNLDIGRYTPDGTATTSAFDGSISQFKLYDTALTAEEVKTLYQMGRCDEGHHVVNFSKTRVGIGLGDGEAPRAALDVRGDIHGGCPVFFQAICNLTFSATAYNNGSGGALIPWNTLFEHKGDCFNTSTGLFTAPIDGAYKFGYSVRKRGGAYTDFWTYIQKNGAPLNGTANSPGRVYVASSSSGPESVFASQAFILDLSAGDTVGVLLAESNNAGTDAQISNSYNSFHGHYIGRGNGSFGSYAY